MKKLSLFLVILASSLLLSSCKGSKCDCPSFAPKKHKSDLHVPIKDSNAPSFA